MDKKEVRCVKCGYIIKKEKKCPLCNGIEFEIGDEMDHFNTTEYNAVTIYDDNPCIERIEGCINCGICTKTCLEREKMPEACQVCVGCGQCIITCPKKVLQPKNDINKFLSAKKEGKICIASIAPATRVAIGDAFGYEEGEFLEGKLIGILRNLGFDYVFDITFGADLTIMEESSELIERLKNKKNLPLITSCCPSWVRYCCIFYPELINNLSTCKSPIGMQSSMICNYFLPQKNVNRDNAVIVTITPCTAKKGEILDSSDSDIVITVSELTDYLLKNNINIQDLKDSKFDDILSNGSGAGLIFGNTGGVSEAVLRTTNYLITKNDITIKKLNNIRKYNGVKELDITIGEYNLKVAAIDEMQNAIPILDSIKQGKCKYDFIEIMNCRGGCIGGGGQPMHKRNKEEEVKQKRIASLYKYDSKKQIRYAHENPNIKKVYKEFLEKPLSEKSIQLLHHTYEDKSSIIDKQ